MKVSLGIEPPLAEPYRRAPMTSLRAYFEIVVPGRPEGKGSVRVDVVYGRDGKPIMSGNRVVTRAHKDSNTVAYMDRISRLVHEACNERPGLDRETPLALHAVAISPRTKDLERPRFPSGRLFCLQKPDFDNVFKGICDAMRAAGFMADDKQICRASCEKFYVARGEAPHLFVRAYNPHDGWMLDPPPVLRSSSSAPPATQETLIP